MGGKQLTSNSVFKTAFITCYILEFLVVYGQGATLADPLYYSLLYGSGYAIAASILAKLIWRKKITRSELLHPPPRRNQKNKLNSAHRIRPFLINRGQVIICVSALSFKRIELHYPERWSYVGASANGPLNWKRREGRTFKEIRIVRFSP